MVGAHYPRTAPTSCLSLNKPLWTSEGWSLGEVNDWKGTMNLAATLNKNWVESRQQAMIVWTIIYL